MKPVLIESPYAANEGFSVEDNIKYAKECMNHSFKNNEAPYASHLIYAQDGLLDDNNPEERDIGIKAGLIWGNFAEKSVVYVDHGISQGMRYGIENAIKNDREIEVRTLRENNQLKENVERYIEEFKQKIGKDKTKQHADTKKSSTLHKM